jgi:hypothetical protein
MAQEPPKYGYQVDETGQIDLLTQLLGPLGSILSALGQSPDAMALNSLTGNPYAGQIGRLSGKTPRYADVLGWENQQSYFKLENDKTSVAQQRIAERWFHMMGSTESNARIRAQNAISNEYFNPVGLGTNLAMMTYGEKGMKRSMAQGYMAMNMYAPGVGEAPNKAWQANMSAFNASLTENFLTDPGSYGGLNLEGTGQVFQQMSQRSILGQNDISKDRITGTTERVKKMSQAVGAMQELFGGTIPELFDKMDAIFGGTAAAMGGDQLTSRIMRMKQTSQLTGQSLNSLAMMSQQGGFYAQQAGMDTGIGAMAAEQTAIQLGVNYSGALPNVRRVNQGRLRQASLQVNTAGATSRMAQWYSGAYTLFLEKNNLDYYSMSAAERATWSNTFKKFKGENGMSIADANSIGDFSAILGVDPNSIRYASMSNRAIVAQQDDENIALAGIRGRVNNAQLNIAASMQRSISRKLNDAPVAMSVFLDDNKQLKSTEVIRKALKDDYGMSNSVAGGILTNILGQYGDVSFGGMNAQEVEAYLYQFRNQDRIRAFRDSRAAMDNELGVGIGGPQGVLNYLLSEDPKKAASVGRTIGAALGLTTPEDMRGKINTAQLKERGGAIARNLHSEFANAMKSGDLVRARQISTVLKGLTSPDAINKLNQDQRESLYAYAQDMQNGMMGESLYNASDILQSPEEELKFQMLKDTGFEKQYLQAQSMGDRLGAEKLGRKAALEGTLKSLKNDKLASKIKSRLYDDEGKLTAKSQADVQKALKGLKDKAWDSKTRDAFYDELSKNKELFSVGDPQLKLENVLSRLVNVLEKFENDQSAKGKPGE